MEKEKVERNYFMLEREKIFQLWNLLLEMIQMEKEKAALFEAHMQDVIFLNILLDISFLSLCGMLYVYIYSGGERKGRRG
jgi:hypothetical protein